MEKFNLLHTTSGTEEQLTPVDFKWSAFNSGIILEGNSFF